MMASNASKLRKQVMICIVHKERLYNIRTMKSASLRKLLVFMIKDLL